jgi:hypothetical protein
MMSDHTSNPDHLDARNSANGDGSPRLSLKPSSSARGAVNGAWWPRSTESAIELGALIEELGAQRTPVRGIALSRVGWDSVPRRIPLASGRKVAVDWVRTGDARMIRISDLNYQRIDLLLIPVNTTPAIAERALRMAADGHDPDITATGSHDPVSGCHPAKAPASPANENDTSDERVPDAVAGIRPGDVVGRRRIVLLPHESS